MNNTRFFSFILAAIITAGSCAPALGMNMIWKKKDIKKPTTCFDKIKSKTGDLLSKSKTNLCRNKWGFYYLTLAGISLASGSYVSYLLGQRRKKQEIRKNIEEHPDFDKHFEKDPKIKNIYIAKDLPEDIPENKEKLKKAKREKRRITIRITRAAHRKYDKDHANDSSIRNITLSWPVFLSLYFTGKYLRKAYKEFTRRNPWEEAFWRFPWGPY